MVIRAVQLINMKIALQAFAFSPDCRHVAVVSDDGYLKVIDALSER